MDLKLIQPSVFWISKTKEYTNLTFLAFNFFENKGFGSVDCPLCFRVYTSEFFSLLCYFPILHYKIITLYLNGDFLKCL